MRENVKEINSKIPCYIRFEINVNFEFTIPHAGLMYTYLAAGCGRKDTHSQGAFCALQRGYVHWASGRLDCLRCNMTPSIKSGIYHVYLLLGKDGQLASILKITCECAAG